MENPKPSKSGAPSVASDIKLVRQAIDYFRSSTGMKGRTVCDLAMDRIEQILRDDGHLPV